MIKEPVSGAGYFMRGLKLIFRPGIRGFVVIPLTINITLFSLGIWYAADRFDRLMEWMLPDWLEWLEWLLWPLFALAALLIVFFGFSLIANLLAAPFNGLLAEAVERHLSGAAPAQQTSWKQVLVNAVPMMLQELWKLVYYVLWAIPFLVLFLIPGLNVAAPLIWFAFSAWMLSLEYSDYPAGNHDIKFRQLRGRLRRRKSLALSFGALTVLATSIPLVNFLVMPVAVAGATAMWVDRLSDESGGAT